jgi:hypothetical protein
MSSNTVPASAKTTTQQTLAMLNTSYHKCLADMTGRFLADPASVPLAPGEHEFCLDQKAQYYKYMNENFNDEYVAIRKIEQGHM